RPNFSTAIRQVATGPGASQPPIGQTLPILRSFPPAITRQCATHARSSMMPNMKRKRQRRENSRGLSPPVFLTKDAPMPTPDIAPAALAYFDPGDGRRIAYRHHAPKGGAPTV